LERNNYSGVDVRQEVVEEGKKELVEAGLSHKEPRIFCVAEISDLQLEISFDIVWSFSVLIHLSDDILRKSLGFIRRHLSSSGVFFANVHVGEVHDGVWQTFPLVSRPMDFYMQVFQDHDFNLSDLGPLRDFGHVHPRLSEQKQEKQRMVCAIPI
jgi:SAM-dependent methyltransferase